MIHHPCVHQKEHRHECSHLNTMGLRQSWFSGLLFGGLLLLGRVEDHSLQLGALLGELLQRGENVFVLGEGKSSKFTVGILCIEIEGRRALFLPVFDDLHASLELFHFLNLFQAQGISLLQDLMCFVHCLGQRHTQLGAQLNDLLSVSLCLSLASCLLFLRLLLFLFLKLIRLTLQLGLQLLATQTFLRLSCLLPVWLDSLDFTFSLALCQQIDCLRLFRLGILHRRCLCRLLFCFALLHSPFGFCNLTLHGGMNLLLTNADFS
mmetsp:Transcript_51023/g.81467  ORF Transcript_51023/g.81467 Transcript_51023/m.81467 type:complete len:264 (+) Transcript_51023:140-931(+)